MKPATSRSRSLMFIGVLVSVVFVTYSLYHLDIDEFIRALSEINYIWLMISVITLFLTMILRSMRWLVIAGLPVKLWGLVWRASCIGYAGTAVLPARAGEIMRVLYLQRSGKVTIGLAIGSSLIDRLVDALTLCALIGLGLVSVVSNSEIQGRFYWMAGTIAAICIAIIGFFVFTERKRGVFDFLRSKGKIRSRIANWGEDAYVQLKHLQNGKLWLGMVVLQLVISILDILACWFLIRSFGWPLPFSAAYLTLIFLAVASTLPSTPGYIGVYQVAAMAALHNFGVTQSQAIAYGTVLQVCSFILFTCVGAWAYMSTGYRHSFAWK